MGYKQEYDVLDDFGETIAEQHQLAVARQEIEYLRRMYARATDQLAQSEDLSARESGIAIYHRIFAPEADIRAGTSAKALACTGPDEWAGIVTEALGGYETTQHLIGTQLVTFNAVEFDEGGIGSGAASMTSYLHAWHVWPNRRLRTVLGTYIDEVKYVQGIGWQIVYMNLMHTSSEHRMLGDPV